LSELMKRIADLRAFRWRMMNGKGDPEVLPAAIDWLDGAIAEHERDMDELLRNGAA
jgi:hypothetical protein